MTPLSSIFKNIEANFHLLCQCQNRIHIFIKGRSCMRLVIVLVYLIKRPLALYIHREYRPKKVIQRILLSGCLVCDDSGKGTAEHFKQPCGVWVSL